MNNSCFINFPILETEHLTLREINRGDYQNLEEIIYYGSYSDSDLTVDDIVQKIKTGYDNHESMNWGIILNGELIGTCGYYRGFKNNTGEIGYIMREKYRRQGYMAEAVEAALDFGFNSMELECITGFTNDTNTPSYALLTKFGFIKTKDLVDRKYRKYEKLKPK